MNASWHPQQVGTTLLGPTAPQGVDFAVKC